MGVSIDIDAKYVELKNRLIGHKSISFKEQLYGDFIIDLYVR